MQKQTLDALVTDYVIAQKAKAFIERKLRDSTSLDELSKEVQWHLYHMSKIRSWETLHYVSHVIEKVEYLLQFTKTAERATLEQRDEQLALRRKIADYWVMLPVIKYKARCPYNSGVM